MATANENLVFKVETYKLRSDAPLTEQQKEALLKEGFSKEQIEEVNKISFYDFLIENAYYFKSGLFNFDEAKQLSLYGRKLYKINKLDENTATNENIKHLTFEQIVSIRGYYPYETLVKLQLNYSDAIKINDYETFTNVEKHLYKITGYYSKSCSHSGLGLETLMKIKSKAQYEVYKYSNTQEAPDYISNLTLEETKDFTIIEQAQSVTMLHLNVNKALAVTNKVEYYYPLGNYYPTFRAVRDCVLRDEQLDENKVKILNDMPLEEFLKIENVNQCLNLMGNHLEKLEL